jgi:hypothetical protein
VLGLPTWSLVLRGRLRSRSVGTLGRRLDWFVFRLVVASRFSVLGFERGVRVIERFLFVIRVEMKRTTSFFRL